MRFGFPRKRAFSCAGIPRRDLLANPTTDGFFWMQIAREDEKLLASGGCNYATTISRP